MALEEISGMAKKSKKSGVPGKLDKYIKEYYPNDPPVVIDPKKDIEEYCSQYISDYLLDIKKLDEYIKEYYLDNAPSVRDSEYDALFKKAQSLEEIFPTLKKDDSPTHRVGAPPAEGFKKYTHKKPMLSLANATTENELMDFHKRMGKLLPENKKESSYYCELKFDGLSISIIYENGKLTHAVTRGNGEEGEEVTANVRTIKNVPLKLEADKPPKYIEIRGEVIFPIPAFRNLNKAQEELGKEPFANPRNAAAGSIRQLDSRLTAERDLSVFAYTIGGVDGFALPKGQDDVIALLKKWGFSSGKHARKCASIGEVWKYYKGIEKKRDSLDVDIDGVVVKINDLQLQKNMGAVARRPRSMIAIKFPPRIEETVLKNIEIQVGRTGVISPVAILEPVNISGVIVSRASLYNKDEIKRKDIRPGDTVVVERAGDVIPKVVRVVREKRTGKEKKFIFPTKCPSCLKKLKQSDGKVAILCVNPKCPAQVHARIAYFASKRAMNIEKMGPSRIHQLIEAKIISKPSDLYKLTKDNFLTLERVKEKSADNFYEAIAKSKKASLPRVIYSLGIPHVGEQVSRLLSSHYKNLDSLMNTSVEELSELGTIGPVVTGGVVSFFKKKSNKNEVKRLITLGINPKDRSAPEGGRLSGKQFVLTGRLPTLTRKQAADFILENGGKVSSGVSKNTNYLLAGSVEGSKMKKALSLGIQIISEVEFLELLNKKQY